MTAATFVMSSLRDGFLNRHSKMAAPLLQTEEDLIAQLELAHTNRSAVRCHETNRFRFLTDCGLASVAGPRFKKRDRPPFDFQPTTAPQTGRAFRAHATPSSPRRRS